MKIFIPNLKGKNSIKQGKNCKNLCPQFNERWFIQHKSIHAKTFILHNLAKFNTPVKPVNVNKNVSLERVVSELLYPQNEKQ
jgi:hypothetical protein